MTETTISQKTETNQENHRAMEAQTKPNRRERPPTMDVLMLPDSKPLTVQGGLGLSWE